MARHFFFVVVNIPLDLSVQVKLPKNIVFFVVFFVEEIEHGVIYACNRCCCMHCSFGYTNLCYSYDACIFYECKIEAPNQKKYQILNKKIAYINSPEIEIEKGSETTEQNKSKQQWIIKQDAHCCMIIPLA